MTIQVHYIFDYLGRPINEYTIKNREYQLSVINLGATITKLIVPNAKGKLENILLRYYDYKLYKDNKYLLGCLLDHDMFKDGKDCIINYPFQCEIEYHSLVFNYQDGKNYINIRYNLNDYLLIEQENNMGLNLSQSLFFNLNGNVKGNILNHKICNNNEKVTISAENGIGIKLSTSGKRVFVNTGKLFNREFYLNKQSVAEEHSGIGLLADTTKIIIEIKK